MRAGIQACKLVITSDYFRGSVSVVLCQILADDIVTGRAKYDLSRRLSRNKLGRPGHGRNHWGVQTPQIWTDPQVFT